MHPPHDSCLLSTLSSLLPFRQAVCVGGYWRTCATRDDEPTTTSGGVQNRMGTRTIPEKLKSKFPEKFVGHQNHGTPKKRFHTVIYHTKKPMYVSADVCMSHTHTHTHSYNTHIVWIRNLDGLSAHWATCGDGTLHGFISLLTVF